MALNVKNVVKQIILITGVAHRTFKGNANADLGTELYCAPKEIIVENLI
jgi:hypothetical protein